MISEASESYFATDRILAGGEQTLLDALMAPDELVLKKGAQVMLIRNIDASLANGSVGHVTGFGRSSSFVQKPSGACPPKGKNGEKLRWPVVEFTTGNGQKRTVIMEPFKWEIKVATKLIASRAQVRSS